MKTSQSGIDLTKSFEGFSPAPYLCPAGKWTIGYGHTQGVNEHSPHITEAQGEIFLRSDIEEAERAVNKYVKVPLQQYQFDALVDFVFNAGAGNFERSSLLKFLNNKQYSLAAMQFLRWVYASNVISKGLVRRRNAERTMFQGDKT